MRLVNPQPNHHRNSRMLYSLPDRRFSRQLLAKFHPVIHPLTNRGRMVYDEDGNRSVLIRTDGSASNNGRPNVRAGCGIVVCPGHVGSTIAFSLERVKGQIATSNRAELRAVHAALQLRPWNRQDEGFQRIVIATDSAYVIKGISEYIHDWNTNGWETTSGEPVRNKDLWQMLERIVIFYENRRIQVQFLHIPRDWNQEADGAAKQGAVSVLVNNFTSFA
ncbi:ribonuclease H-like domain-containing protein [Mycena floridula]|nr:ribonuclease H-like domain-containing protein [Mycena floridula]